MGKRKIEIKFITDQKVRLVTFSKRKKGLFGKVSDFIRDFNVDVGLVLISETGRVYTGGNSANEALRLYSGVSTTVGDDRINPVAADDLEVKKGFLNVDVGNLSAAELDVYSQDLSRMRSRLMERVTGIRPSSSSWPTTTTGGADSTYLATSYPDATNDGTAGGYYMEDSNFLSSTATINTDDPYSRTSATNEAGDLCNNPMTNYAGLGNFYQAPSPVDSFLSSNTYPTESVFRGEVLQSDNCYIPTLDEFAQGEPVVHDRILPFENYYPLLDDQMLLSENYFPTLDEFTQSEICRQMMYSMPSFWSASIMDTDNTPTFSHNNLWATED